MSGLFSCLVSSRAGEQLSEIKRGYTLFSIYTDFSSAFQNVNHRLLLPKLEQMYETNGSTLKWLTSYLERREQEVIINGKAWYWVSAISGQSEGGHMFSLQFSLASVMEDVSCMLLSLCVCVSMSKMMSSNFSRILTHWCSGQPPGSWIWTTRSASASNYLKKLHSVTTYSINDILLKNCY